MLHHKISYFFFGIGGAALLFSLTRTYYLVWKMKKEREAKKPQAVSQSNEDS